MFLEFLLEQNIIDKSQYNLILTDLDSKFEGSITKGAISLGISEDIITQKKSEFYKVPYQKVNSEDVKYDTLKFISEDSARHYKLVPIAFSENVLSIGITEPENIEGMNALQFISANLSIPFKIFLISYSDFIAVIENYKALSKEVDIAVEDLNLEIEDAKKSTIKENLYDKQDKKEIKIVEDAPIIKIVAVIISHAVEGGASDIHIENVGKSINVRYRVDGILHRTLTLPINTFDGIIARIKILSKLRLDEKRKPQDGSFSSVINNRNIEFRVSTMPSYFGEKVVMRILDPENGVKSMDKLELTNDHFNMLKEAINRPYGLILISGPTGSGKSTTLYSILNEVDKEGKNVISLEDPVEFQISGVTQSQVMPEIGYTFAAGLRSILRQDPNIIMVGEIRDKETAQLAIQASLTGHLVFSTIHTNNSIGIVPRLIDMGIDPYLIAPTLILGMAQRLLRRVNPSCRHEVLMDGVTSKFIEDQFKDLSPEYLNKLNFSNKMYELKPSLDSSSLTKGRIAIFEMFSVDKDIQELILKNPGDQEMYKILRSKGMITLKEDALIKALDGKVPMQEVYGL